MSSGAVNPIAAAAATPRRHAGRGPRAVAGWLTDRGPTSLLWIVFALIVTFVYVPIIVVALFSFDTNSTMSWPLSGLTLHWYGVFFHDSAMLGPLLNSAKVAGSSIGIALVIGVPAAVAIDRFSFPGKGAFQKLLILPFVVPGVLGGISLLTFFLLVKLNLSLLTVIIAHATLVTAAVVLQTAVALTRLDRNLESAAMDLGAHELRAFWSVTLPSLRNALVGAALLGATISLDEVTRTFFVTGTQNTLPMRIWSMMRTGITPEVNAVATLVFFVSLGLLLVWTAIVTREGQSK